MIKSPLLAHTIKDIEKIEYDILCSPKLDGIRCLIIDNTPVSRTFKPIKNTFVRETLESLLSGYSGLDGELISGDNFNVTQGDIMRTDGMPEFVYHVFDYVESDTSVPFVDRYKQLSELPIYDNPHIKLVQHSIVCSSEELLIQEEIALENNFEGVMVRSLDGVYKCGRSTIKQGTLGKLKRFTDAEAIVIGFTEQEHNGNKATKDAFGRTKRSSHKENKTGLNTLGALTVEFEDNTFNIGTGFDDVTRQTIWDERELIIGQLVKFKYQAAGRKNAPRFPSFVGFRNKEDI